MDWAPDRLIPTKRFKWYQCGTCWGVRQYISHLQFADSKGLID